MTRHTTMTGNDAELLLDAFDVLAEGIAIFDEADCFVMANPVFRRMMAHVEDLLVPGTDYRDILRAGVTRGYYAVDPSIAENWIADFETRVRHQTGPEEIVDTEGRIYRVAFHATRQGGFVVARTDVTEQRRAEAMAREREALLTTILDTNPTPVIMARLSDSKIIYRSRAADDFLIETDYARDFYVSAEDRTAYLAALKDTGRVSGFRLPTKASGDRVRQISLSGGLTEFQGETVVVSSIADLTEQIERERMIRMVVEACPTPLLLNRAATGEILFKSPKAVELYGTVDNAAAFYADPSDRAAFLKALRRTGELHDYRERFINAEGETIWVALAARLIEWEGEEVIVSHPRDLTQQLAIEAELDRQRAQLFQNEKMSALGGLMAGVAHELNNPLSVVVGHALMLQDEAADESVLRKTRKIGEAAERCAKIVKTFLSMARQEPGRMEPADLNQVVETAAEVARYGGNSHNMRIETDLAGDLPDVLCDEDQIAQVVINLIVNASQAMADSGRGDRVRISTALRSGGQSVLLKVEDNGPGIPADIRGRVFEPFFTTKGVGRGTGIGLAMCHRIVTAHDGRIEVSPSPDGGASFAVTLPVSSAVRPPIGAVQVPVSQPRQLRVLIIDDEEDVADLNAEVLTRAGFQAEAVFSGEAGIDRLRSGTYDVVVSDLSMPGMDGRAVYDSIGREFPDLLPCTGFITGDTMGRASQGFLAESGRPYLEKPVSPRELREFVARLGDQGAAR